MTGCSLAASSMVFPIKGSDAGKGFGETRTNALLPQPETGKINCVDRLSCARLSPGAWQDNSVDPNLVPNAPAPTAPQIAA